MPRQLFHGQRFGYGRLSTDLTKTRFSMHYKSTSIARDGATFIPRVFYLTADGQEVTVEESEVPQILLQARPAFRHPGFRAVREELDAAPKARGFFGSRRGASDREQGPAYEALEYSRVDTAHQMRKAPQTRTLSSRVPRREPRSTQRRKLRSTCREAWRRLRRVHSRGRADRTKAILSRSDLDIRRF